MRDGILPRQNNYILSDKERVNELIGFGLRINKGIDLSEIPMGFQNEVNRSIVQIESKWGNYLIQKTDRLKLTPEGFAFADAIAVDLMLE